MGTVTDSITYNVRERGRKHLGRDRNFDTVALAKLINGPVVQERVKLGDMLGYLGHWPRIKFGMDPAEGGVVDGKVVSVAQAVRTVELKADDAGNISHRAEFLDTNEGRLAEALYRSKVGGFSSAIDIAPGSSPSIPVAFYGFDYVAAQGGPNYTTNRGHRALLDAVTAAAGADLDVREEMMELLDAVAADASASSSHLLAMFEALQQQHRLALETLDSVTRENDLLIGRLASQRTGVLDDVLGEGGSALPPLSGRSTDFEKFRAMPLVALNEKADSTDDSPELVALERHRGVKV